MSDLSHSFSLPDSALARGHDLVLRHLPPERPVLYLKPPSTATVSSPQGSFFWHPWFPENARLKAAGWTESLEPEREGPWAGIVGYGGKQKEENLHLVRAGAGLLAPGGSLLFLVPNDYGSKSYLKPLQEVFEEVSYESGRKSRLYLLRSPRSGRGSSELVPFQPIESDPTLVTCPGLFSWKKPDRGSQLLVEALQGRSLRGPVADLGAGWGYLSRHLPKELEIHLLEADRRGLEACRRNLPEHNLTLHWCDVTTVELASKFATVLCNPPFHTAKKSEPALGAAFLARAFSLLKTGGEMFLVGNVHLPYARLAGEFFGEVETVTRRDGFLVVRARK